MLLISKKLNFFLNIIMTKNTESNNFQRVSWRKGKKPRFSPENIWFTASQISNEAAAPINNVSELLENNPAFVRAANLESIIGEPVYAFRSQYVMHVNLLGKVVSVLVNKIIG